MPRKILVVDDEPLIVKGLRFSLEQEGYAVDCAYDGLEAVSMIRSEEYDLILLDIMLPKMDGLKVCQLVREFSNIPIIMLTAKGDDVDKILGLEYGADDYMTKPFNVLEVKVRIKNVLRRAYGADSIEEESGGGVRIRPENRSIILNGRVINLTTKEFEIMKLFISNPGKVFSREQLLEVVWKYDYSGDLRTVDVHIRRLREKIEKNPGQPEHIFTKWGVGYYFVEK